MVKLSDIYRVAVDSGIDADPRSREDIERLLSLTRKEYEELPESRKRFFDTDALENPFADTRILTGDDVKDIKKAFAGIDIGSAEVLLVDRLNQMGRVIDLIISHHPVGRARLFLADVMPVQADVWQKMGVNISVGESLIGDRQSEVRNSVRVSNARSVIDAARLLGIDLMCTHTVADNHVQKFTTKLIEDKKPYRVGDIVDLLFEVPEFQSAAKDGDPPMISVGKKENRAGKIMVDMTGGTEGPKEIVSNLATAGVSTIVNMYLSNSYIEEAKKNKINVVLCGHMACDSIGMNYILDQIEKLGVEIVAGSGLYRVRR